MMAGISLEQWIWYVLIGVLFVAGAGALALRSNRRPDR
jgi:LPXTG-motif cell wall-anchored protein